MRGGEVDAAVVVAEEQPKSSGAHIGGRTVYLYRIVAVAVAFDPSCGGPFADAPGRVILRATMLVGFAKMYGVACVFVTYTAQVYTRGDSPERPSENITHRTLWPLGP